MARSGLLTPDLRQVALRLVRLGELVILLGVLAHGPVGLLVTEDVQSVPVLVAMLLVLLAIAGLVERHDWSAAISNGRASLHAEVWAYTVLVTATVVVVVAIPWSGSWLYYLVIAVYFAVLLPTGATARVGAVSLVGLVVGEGWAAGTGAPQVLTAALGVTMIAIVAHATSAIVVQVVGQSERRARMLATAAQSSRAVASLDPDEVRDRLFRTAVSNAEALQATLESLLEFARAEQGRSMLEQAEPVDLSDVVLTSVERLDSLLLDHDVHVDAPRPAVVQVVTHQLDRVVDNLLLNACRHTPEGTRVDVTVRTVGEDRVRVVVADRGPGIDPEDLPHLTDRFFRGGESTTRPTRGMGLGLALVQSILVAHDSELLVESEPGSGSRFWFELPTRPGHA